jgi:flagellar basal-body rod modification protein FlgD
MEISGIRSARDLGLAASTAAAKGNEELGKNAFLELMVAQFNNQNPLEPTKNEDFIAQLAQFSSLEGIQNLNTSMETMAAAMFSSTAVQAASLVGRSVLAPASRAMTEGNGLAGNVVNNEPGSGVVVEISDAAGGFVRRLDLGSQPEGDVRFVWDGTNEASEQLPAGVYRFRAYAVGGEQPIQLDVQLPERVASVSFEGGQAKLNLTGGASIDLSDVRELQ